VVCNVAELGIASEDSKITKRCCLLLFADSLVSGDWTKAGEKEANIFFC
jgi:hypothetical protein